MKKRRFDIETPEDLRRLCEEAGVEIPVSEDLAVLGEEVTVAGHKLANRFVAQPMEGKDADPGGAPGELTFRRYERFAAGGSALVWFEAAAVVPEGRSSPGQLWINSDNAAGFGELVDRARNAASDRGCGDIVLILQLTHSGRYSMPEGRPAPVIAQRNPVLDPVHGLTEEYPLVSDEYLDGLQESYVKAAGLAADAGFDGVDVKACHRYLVSELLASFEREGKYGGPLENRSRFLVETVSRIACGFPEISVTARMNAYDALPWPWGFGVDREDSERYDLTEPIELARKLGDAGISMLSLSIGNPRFDAHYGRPSDSFGKGRKSPDEHPIEGIARFLDITRQIQSSCNNIPVLGGSYAWLRHLMPYTAAGVVSEGWSTLVGQGRGMFAYPDSVNDILSNGRMDPGKCCITCSLCAELLARGARAGCVVRDRDIYDPGYRNSKP